MGGVYFDATFQSIWKMKHRTFFWFILPTATAMLLFIAFPLVSVLLQSVHAPHPAVLIEVETCTPLVGCTEETTIDQEATRELREAEPLGRFVGFDIFFGWKVIFDITNSDKNDVI